MRPGLLNQGMWNKILAAFLLDSHFELENNYLYYVKRILFTLLLLEPVFTKAQIITTIAGNGIMGYSGDGILATTAELYQPGGLAADKSGNIYIADISNNRIRRVSPTGIITTIAGTGVPDYTGDGGLATAATLNAPSGIAIDDSGNIFIADSYNNCIRKVNTLGLITTIVGTGFDAGTSWGAYSGDGGPATAADLWFPLRVAIDAGENIYVVDVRNNRIRRVDSAGIINTIIGDGTSGFYGDGGPATLAKISQPVGIAIDTIGNIYFSDEGNNRIRKVTADGVINTIAGNGTAGFSGDGTTATSAEFNVPNEVAIDGAGNIYISDTHNERIRKIEISGIINTIAGDGTGGYAGDGGPATASELYWPSGLAFDSYGDMYISDFSNIKCTNNEQ
jgi:sugar lactone lactonase YvrE